MGGPLPRPFPGEGAGSLVALCLTVRRKGFLGGQERLLRRPRQSRMTWSSEKSLAENYIDYIRINDLKYIGWVSLELNAFCRNLPKN
jgi:hypothetical protein